MRVASLAGSPYGGSSSTSSATRSLVGCSRCHGGPEMTAVCWPAAVRRPWLAAGKHGTADGHKGKKERRNTCCAPRGARRPSHLYRLRTGRGMPRQRLLRPAAPLAEAVLRCPLRWAGCLHWPRRALPASRPRRIRGPLPAHKPHSLRRPPRTALHAQAAPPPPATTTCSTHTVPLV